MREKIMEVLGGINEEIVEDMDRDLIATEIIDSFDIVKLVVELEAAFDIVIDVDLVEPDNFCTANAIISMVENLLKEQ
ncbi:MAG: acyl carrier protein [Lachnospiraceae bacterium]|nr:acyl carrier protein [Lachnospiraceae bacterium]